MSQTTSLVTSFGTSNEFKPSPGQRRSRTRLRVPLTATNLGILRTLLKHRLLTVDQIQRQCLPCTDSKSLAGRLEYTRHLLRALHEHKYVLRRTLIQPGLGRSPLVFACTWQGAQAVVTHDDCQPQDVGWDPHDKVITWSNENLQHLVAENEVYFTFQAACEQADVALQLWKSDRTLLKEHKGQKVKYAGPHGGMYEKVLIPDGYYCFARPVTVNGRTGTRLDRITVEVDMGTQTLKQRQQTIKYPQRTWEHKVKAYLAYFQPGGMYEQLYGSTAGRVLTITTSEERLRNMRQATQAVGGNERFWFCTFAEFMPGAAVHKPIYRVVGHEHKRPLMEEEGKRE